jgi:Lon protease-like protein
MVTDCMGGHRVIGTILLRPGWEADYHGRPPLYDVGCAGLIEQCESLPDGRFNILLRGVSRFRVLEERKSTTPYRLAAVEALPETDGDSAALRGRRQQLFAAIAKAADGPTVLVLQNEMADDLFVNALCQSLKLSPVEQQSLLDCGGALERCERLLELLEFRHLEQTYGKRRDTVH